MLDAIKSLFENNVISEEVKTDIEQAWNDKLTENRNQVTVQLREEFAQKYEHDKSLIVEAMDRIMQEQLREEITQFLEDRQQLAEQKAKYAIKMKKDSDLMKEFVTRQLANEMKDLHSDQSVMVDKFYKLEEFVIEALAKEVSEFYGDKQDIIKTKVKLVREGKEALTTLKGQLIKKTAVMVENLVEQTLTKEISQLKEDIEVARQHEFGRKLFEAFAGEYQTSYLNENSETKRLLKLVDKKNKEVMEAKTRVSDALHIIKNKDVQVKKLLESKQRQEIMHELISPLAHEQKGIMTNLLESVQTSKLRDSFDKYLPSVVNGVKPTKKVLVESKEITGDKVSSSISSNPDANIIDIRRLAGI
jgi:hypothetical protein